MFSLFCSESDLIDGVTNTQRQNAQSFVAGDDLRHLEDVVVGALDKGLEDGFAGVLAYILVLISIMYIVFGYKIVINRIVKSIIPAIVNPQIRKLCYF